MVLKKSNADLINYFQDPPKYYRSYVEPKETGFYGVELRFMDEGLSWSEFYSGDVKIPFKPDEPNVHIQLYAHQANGEIRQIMRWGQWS
jgi:hypothetical protein